MLSSIATSLLLSFGIIPSADDAVHTLELLDVFELEYASDPRISPDGSRVVYVRNSKDVMKDRNVRNLWIVGAGGDGHRPLTMGNSSHSSPRWS
ncbi:MAG: dipeptidyl aminopeptidase/acylaminoacyl peptidase, partial [Planctomycetota bacterium]